MIRYLKNHQVDRNLWDACIADSHNGIIYAYSWYLDIVSEGWDALVNEDYSILMPLCKKNKYFMDYIYPPFFTQQLGVFSKKPVSENEYMNFFNAIPASIRFIEMNLHISNNQTPSNFSSTENKDYILGLSNSYEIIKKNYSENHRRNCAKAEKNGLEIFTYGNVEKIIEMFLQNKGKDIHKLKPKHYDIFRKLTKAVMERNMGQIRTVNDPHGVPCGGAVFFESHNNAIFIFSAITPAGKSLLAMHFLIDRYIRENCLIKKALDFEGSNDPDLARFYKGFGSQEFVYLQIRKSTLPPPWSWVKK